MPLSVMGYLQAGTCYGYLVNRMYQIWSLFFACYEQMKGDAMC